MCYHSFKSIGVESVTNGAQRGTILTTNYSDRRNGSVIHAIGIFGVAFCFKRSDPRKGKSSYRRSRLRGGMQSSLSASWYELSNLKNLCTLERLLLILSSVNMAPKKGTAATGAVTAVVPQPPARFSMATVSVVQSEGAVDSVDITAGSATTGGGSNGRTVYDAPVIVIAPGKMLMDVSIVGIRGGGGPGRR